MRKNTKDQVDKILDYFKVQADKLRKTVLPLTLASIIGVLMFIVSMNLLMAVSALAGAYFLFKSRNLEWDIFHIFILVTIVAYGFNPNWPLAVFIGLGSGFIAYTILAIAIPNAARKSKWFTFINLNEYKVIQTGENMLNRYIGIGERWVNEEGVIEDAAKKSLAAKLVGYVPDPKTGKLHRADSLGLFTKLGLITRLSQYLVKRTGAIWVGIPQVTNVKKFDMNFKVMKNGKPVPKTYQKDKAATSIFDSFTYLFTAESLETANLAKATLNSLMTMTVDNLHTPSYVALPAGIWVDKAEEVFLDIVRIHAARTDFGTLLKERRSSATTMTDEEIAQYEADNKAKFEQARATLYEELMSPEAKQRFIGACGHFPTNVLIGDITLDGNKEYADSFLLKQIAQNKTDADLITQKGRTKVAEEAVQTAKHEKAAEIEKLKAKVKAAESYVLDVIIPIADNPKALDALNTHAVSQMPNLQVLGGTAGVFLNPKNEGGEK